MHAWEAIDESINYIEDHLSEEINTKYLAERVFLSPFYFQRLFKRLVKKSVQEYIKLRRLAVAIDLLKNTEYRIVDIAVKLGFSDHSNFTRAFKETYHLTQADFRKKKPYMNVIDKPNISSNYMLIDEEVPLIIGDVVLEISNRSLDKDEFYLGIEKEIAMDQQVPVGESTGIDDPGELWKLFYDKKYKLAESIQEGIEIGMSYGKQFDKKTFMYFVGGKSVSFIRDEFEDAIKKSIPQGKYIVCHIEAETKEALVSVALNQAYQYLFSVWLPKHELIIEPISIEKYFNDNEVNTMELWLKIM